MNVSGEKTFAAPREAVWKVLNDPASMAKTMPGVESFDIHDENRWTANVKIPLGLGALRMTVDMEKIEEREPEFAKLAVKGNGVGAMLNMETSFTLADAPEGGTAMAWSAGTSMSSNSTTTSSRPPHRGQARARSCKSKLAPQVLELHRK